MCGLEMVKEETDTRKTLIFEKNQVNRHQYKLYLGPENNTSKTGKQPDRFLKPREKREDFQKFLCSKYLK